MAMNKAEMEFHYLLKARATLVWVTTTEERRVERAIAGIASAKGKGYAVRYWDCATGATDITGAKVDLSTTGIPDVIPAAVFAHIRERSERAVWIMRDLDAWLADPMNLRGLKSLARDLQEEVDQSAMTTIIVLSTGGEIPQALRSSVTMIDWPLPNRDEIAAIVDDVSNVMRIDANGHRDDVIDAAQGLTADDISASLARSIAEFKKLDAAIVRAEKKRIIDRERVLTWYEPDPRGLDAIGGLGLLKRWLLQRRAALTLEAREFGLPAPRGVLLVGAPGNGKSLTAKCLPAAWGGLPLLRLDMGALKSKYVGESEANIRRALKVAEACAPVVLWLDEIEKSISSSSGHLDGGVSADALGTILTWLQERAGAVFVVATANDATALPPELTRKGRFDDVFFVDMPNADERVEILTATILSYKRDPETFDLHTVSRATPDFTGAELAELIPAGLFEAFEQKRELDTNDLINAASNIVPIAKSAVEKLSVLRAWAASRARPASEALPVAAAKAVKRGSKFAAIAAEQEG